MTNKAKRITSGAIAGLLCITTMATLLTGCGKKEEEGPTYALTPVAESDLQAGLFYAKTPDGFYELPAGTRNYTDKELIAKEADSSRIVWFGEDDVCIPTLYKDDQLVYCTSETIPSAFTWERYKDQGYTIGISGLTVNEANRYSVPASEASLKLDSSFVAGLAEVNDDDVLIVDKVDGKSVNNTNVSEGGTITGLTAGKEYNVDTYVGSAYTSVACTADTHAFSSYELYETSTYSFAQSNYIILTVPNYLRSGYYYMNGIGMVKYANVTREEGISAINFNSPYYLGTDEEGNIITADDKVDTTDTTEETSKNVYTSKFYIDCTNEKMVVDVAYSDILTEINGVEINASDAVLESLKNNQPKVTMVGPDEKSYVFAPSNQAENTLECTVDMPLSGEWTVTLEGFDLRTFDISHTLTSGHSDTMMHTGSGKASMTYYLKDSLDQSVFEISWENKDRAATVEITGPDKTKYSKALDESCVIDEGYGYIVMKIDNAKFGNYEVSVEGDELGRVRVTSQDYGNYQNAEMADAEVVENE